MPVAVAVAVGSPVLLAVLAVLAAVAQAADSMAHQATMALQELMDLVAAEVAVLPWHPQQVQADQESSLCATSYLLRQHPIWIAHQTVQPITTTSRPHEHLHSQGLHRSLRPFNFLLQQQVLLPIPMQQPATGQLLDRPVPPTPHPVHGHAPLHNFPQVSTKFVQRRPLRWTDLQTQQLHPPLWLSTSIQQLRPSR